MSSELLDYAKAYHADGCTVLPVAEGDKKPAGKWKALCERPQLAEELPGIFSRPGLNIGILGGSASRSLAVVDVDSLSGWARLDRIPAFRRLKARAPVVKSPHGYHVYTRTPILLRGSVCREYSVDIKAEGGHIVAPPSELRQENGKRQLYMFSEGYFRPIYEMPPDEYAELAGPLGFKPYEETAPILAEDGTLAAGDSEAFFGLGLNAWRILRGDPEALTAFRRDPERKDGSRSAAEAAVVYRCAAIGWRFGEVRELFRGHAGAASKYREKERAGWGDAYLGPMFRTAETSILEKMSARDRAVNGLLLALEARNPFTGRAAATDRTVLRALLQVSREAGRLDIRPGYRQLAERAGLSLSKVYGAVERLEEAGLVSRLLAPRKQAVFFCERERLAAVLSDGESPQVAPGIARRIALDHDAYRSKALGKQGHELLAAIRAKEGAAFKAADLALPRHYIRRALAILERAELLVREEAPATGKRGRPAVVYRARRTFVPSDLDRIAEEAGTAGMGKRQRETFKAERARWGRAYL